MCAGESVAVVIFKKLSFLWDGSILLPEVPARLCCDNTDLWVVDSNTVRVKKEGEDETITSSLILLRKETQITAPVWVDSRILLDFEVWRPGKVTAGRECWNSVDLISIPQTYTYILQTYTFPLSSTISPRMGLEQISVCF